MTPFVRSLLIFLLAPLAGCGHATPGPDGPSPDRYWVRIRGDVPGHRSMIDAPIERVEKAVESAYRHLGFPVGRADDHGELVYITPPMRVDGRLYDGEMNSTFIDCGKDFGRARADSHRVEFAMMTRLRADGEGGTLVETILDGLAEDPAGNGPRVPCSGTGVLEAEIAELLRRNASA